MSVVEHYKNFLEKDKEVPVAIAAVKALSEVIKRSEASTIMGLHTELTDATNNLKQAYPYVLSLASSCELFQKFVTRTTLEHSDIETCKANLNTRASSFLEISMKSRKKIADFGKSFISDGCVVLTHGYSRVVMEVLLAAAERKQFSVIVTLGPDKEGQRTAQKLQENNVPVSLIHDVAVGRVMEQVSMVFTGAEGVVENGGVVNRIGTYPIAIMANQLKKNVYVAAESYKFVRFYPLKQRDLSNWEKDPLNTSGDVEVQQYMVDYTPPKNINLLITDLGVLTPSAVSDELIQMYA